MKRGLVFSMLVMFVISYSFAQTKPFPQNVNYPYGFKPTTITSDIVQAEYTKFKNLLVTECGEDLRVIYSDNKSQTRGEAIGFGMILAAYAGDRETFDGLFRFYLGKRTVQAKNMMAWNVTCEGIVDAGSATDIDIDVAYGLIVAYEQWGSTYLDEAKKIISLLDTYMITNCNGVKTIYPGYNNFPWGGCNETDIQYYTPAFFRVFAKVSEKESWNQMADDSYIILNNGANKETGLVPDWQTASGDGLPPSYRVNYFRYDACRVPWRMSLEYLWSGNEEAKKWCTTISNWAFGEGPENIKDGYDLDGTPRGNNHNSAFVGGLACSAMCNNQEIADAFGTEMKNISDSYWFNLSTRCLYLFTMSGNFWEPLKKDSSSSGSKSDLKKKVLIHPNPAKNGVINLEFQSFGGEKEINVKVFNSEGKVEFEEMVSGTKPFAIHLGQKPGVYIISVSGKEFEYSNKVIVK